MRRQAIRTAGLLTAAVLLAAGGAGAQEWQTRSASCSGWGGDGERVCEERTTTFPSTGSLRVSGGVNGGITVTSWDRDEVEVVATVRARAESASRAAELLGEVEIRASRGGLEADGPDNERREGWGVGWEIRVPRSIDLELRTTNGGIDVEGVAGNLEIQTTNGGIDLDRVSGSVDGHTTNGGIHLALSGDRWSGRGIDLHTTNGGIRVEVPDGFDADLDVQTTNGGIELGFPVMVEGRIGRRLRTTVGDGGPSVRLRTTNGNVEIIRR